MDKIDFKKRDRAHFSGKVGRYDVLTIPPIPYLMIDGQGDPSGAEFGRALAALYPLAFGVKFMHKSRGHDHVVGPLEGLWWAEDHRAFALGFRTEWKWTAMIRQLEGTTEDDLAGAREKALAKLAKDKEPATDAATINAVRLEMMDEGEVMQILHVGPFADEAPILERMHAVEMPERGLDFAGHHHEIYLSDPRRVAPEKLRTILRQPVKPRA